MRDIDRIIIHCSATPEGRNWKKADVERDHLQKGYDCVGYHYIIDLDGTIEKGRPEEKIGAHCRGYNKNSIGVCYIGGCDAKLNAKDTRTAAQRASLVKLVKGLQDRYPGALICGHNELANKACPSFDVQKWRKEDGL